MAELPPAFAADLLRWFAAHGRRDLPWQHPATPYRVWVSEVMLQQTQVNTVIPYYQRFMVQFPDLPTLAAAPLDAVLALWAGLGYYARARHLHQAAQQVMNHHQGQLPTALEHLQALPGIGRSTAGAILALSAGQRHAILDGNVKRVLARYGAVPGWPGLPAVAAQLWQLAEHYTPTTALAAYTQAMMDLGATVCTRNQPRCPVCPLRLHCLAHQQGRSTAYPSPRPRQVLPRRQVCGLLLSQPDGRILLLQRPPSGIWGGLWSLPEAADLAQAAQWCAAQGLQLLTPLTPRPLVQHTFTHFQLELLPVQAQVQPEATAVRTASGRWVESAEYAHLGLPAPIRRLLADLH